MIITGLSAAGSSFPGCLLYIEMTIIHYIIDGQIKKNIPAANVFIKIQPGYPIYQFERFSRKSSTPRVRGKQMIELTRLNRKTLFVNSDLIELVEETPDTVVTLTNGRKLIVTDSALEILDKVVAFRNRCFHEGNIQVKTGDDQKL